MIRRTLCAALSAAALIAPIAACSSPAPAEQETRPAVSAPPINPDRPSMTLADLEAEYIVKLRSVNIVPDHATPQQARTEGQRIAADVRRTVPRDNTARLHTKVVQLADALAARYGVTEEQGAYWVGAALGVYAPAWAGDL